MEIQQSQQAPRTPTRTKKKREVSVYDICNELKSNDFEQGDTPDVERQHFESDMAHPSPVIEIAQRLVKAPRYDIIFMSSFDFKIVRVEILLQKKLFALLIHLLDCGVHGHHTTFNI